MTLAGLALIFVLMTAVWPLRQMRNLDVLLVAASSTIVIFMNDGLIGRMVLASCGLLIYLGARCLLVSLGAGSAASHQTPVFEHLTRGWSQHRRIRALRWGLAAVALVVAMVGISSSGAIDVCFAVMEGATRILHGVLPYGHLPDVFHGDTYPIGSYLMYLPAALLSPVRDSWDSVDLGLAIAVAAALGCAWALGRAAAARRLCLGRWRQASPQRGTRCDAARAAGLRAAIAWLSFPPLLATVSSGTSDVVLALIMAGALLFWRRPAVSALLLTTGAWFKLVPVFLLPLWLARFRAARLRAGLLAVLGASLLPITVLLALGGPAAIAAMLHAVSFQASRSSPDSLWSLVGSVPLQQGAQAMTVGLIVGGAVALRRDPALRSDQRRVAALAAVVLVGVQLSANYWSYLYFSWLFPFLALSLLGTRPLPVQSRRPSAGGAFPPDWSMRPIAPQLSTPTGRSSDHEAAASP